MPRISELRHRAEAILQGAEFGAETPGDKPGFPAFSPFVPEHLDRALDLVTTMMALADGTGGNDGLAAALDEAQRATATDPGAARHALMVFITHHRSGSRLPIAALEQRRPALVHQARRAIEEAGSEGHAGEAALAWYRTDPLANQHHEHWHVVYPWAGVPDGSGGRRLQDRHGELFLYMHQQMLARYDTERFAAGLEPVAPLSDFRAPIEEGFDPGQPGLVPRPPGAVLADVDLPGLEYSVADHENADRAVRGAADTGSFGPGDPVDIDSLGNTAESSRGSVDPARFGSLHNLGHVILARIGATDPDVHGAMWGVDTAITDPVFYRWHRHIDDIAAGWQDGLAPHAFDDAPPVRLRRDAAGVGTDVALCRGGDIPSGDIPDGVADPAALAAWGQATFGGDAWDTPAGDLAPAATELRTRFVTRRITGQGSLRHLDHDDFVTVVRVANLADTPTPVTVRIFLVAEELAADRRNWIELDRFREQLAPRSRTVLVRPDALSAVVQKPAVRPPRPRRSPGTNAALNYCNCGWPWNLLLPRGTVAGMAARLLVLLTDGTLDATGPDPVCGSTSFCGARDATYPDARPMGYPFDRPFPGGVLATLGGLDQAGLVPVTLRHQA